MDADVLLCLTKKSKFNLCWCGCSKLHVQRIKPFFFLKGLDEEDLVIRH